jgi:hypothetical protein
MKKLLLSVLVTGLLVSATSQAGTRAKAFDASHERTLVSLCEAVRSNNKMRLHHTLKQARISYSEMQEGLVCNGKDPMTFAMLNGSEDNAHLIAKRTNIDPSSIVAKN